MNRSCILQAMMSSSMTQLARYPRWVGISVVITTFYWLTEASAISPTPPAENTLRALITRNGEEMISQVDW